MSTITPRGDFGYRISILLVAFTISRTKCSTGALPFCQDRHILPCQILILIVAFKSLVQIPDAMKCAMSITPSSNNW